MSKERKRVGNKKEETGEREVESLIVRFWKVRTEGRV